MSDPYPLGGAPEPDDEPARGDPPPPPHAGETGRAGPESPATGAGEPEAAIGRFPAPAPPEPPVLPVAVPPLPGGEPPRRAGAGGRLLVPFLAALLGGVIGVASTLVVVDRAAVGEGGVVRVAPPIEAAGERRPDLVADVAEAVMPSIVQIQVLGRAGAAGTGSGVIYRTDGYIITNDHVVADADSIRVRLSTGEQLDGSLVGTAAPAVDIAVIKVVPPDGELPAATIGSTKALRPGELAIAIGSPFGLEGTVTAGVISALHRNVTLGRGVTFTDAIQTDAPINPGNSGGALVNASGAVIGINTAIISQTGGNVGVGFAIPIDIARKVTDQIIATGSASLPFLGISGESLPGDRGALVREVLPGGPARAAGMREGDIIVGLDGERVTSMDDLISKLLEHDVGDAVRVEILRDGDRRTIEVILAARPGNP